MCISNKSRKLLFIEKRGKLMNSSKRYNISQKTPTRPLSHERKMVKNLYFSLAHGERFIMFFISQKTHNFSYLIFFLYFLFVMTVWTQNVGTLILEPLFKIVKFLKVLPIPFIWFIYTTELIWSLSFINSNSNYI